jgi:hypothetical protein
MNPVGGGHEGRSHSTSPRGAISRFCDMIMSARDVARLEDTPDRRSLSDTARAAIATGDRLSFSRSRATKKEEIFLLKDGELLAT